MKKIFILIILLTMCSKVLSLPYELYFYVHNISGDCVSFNVTEYNLNWVQLASGQTLNYAAFNQYGPANGVAQILPHNDGGLLLPTFPRSGSYYIVIGLSYFELDLDNYISGDLYIDYNIDTRICTIRPATTPHPGYGNPLPLPNTYELVLKNDFAQVSSGSGLFNYDGSTVSSPTYDRVYNYPAAQSTHTISAVSGLDQIYQGSPQIFQVWSNSSAISYQNTFTTNLAATAFFRSGFKITLKNSYDINRTDGSIFYGSNQQNSPYDIAILPGNQISATAINQTKIVPGNMYNNAISFTFDHWSNGTTSQTLNTIPESNNLTYFCYLKGKPIHYDRNLGFNYLEYGQNVHLTWNAFNDPGITGYAIWRRVKHNNVLGKPVNIVTITDRFTTSYIDFDYVVTQLYIDLVSYDVRAIYSPVNSNWTQSPDTADPNFSTIFGQVSTSLKEEKNKNAALSASEKQLPAIYSFSNYPNPFNPVTTINYALPENTNVKITISDIQGKEIAVLVNQRKEAGNHQVEFAAGRLTSGVYIMTLHTDTFIQSKKIVLIK